MVTLTQENFEKELEKRNKLSVEEKIKAYDSFRTEWSKNKSLATRLETIENKELYSQFLYQYFLAIPYIRYQRIALMNFLEKHRAYINPTGEIKEKYKEKINEYKAFNTLDNIYIYDLDLNGLSKVSRTDKDFESNVQLIFIKLTRALSESRRYLDWKN